ncbi:AAA family ATPase [Rhizobium ruizarguesonis]|uniref:AAA family ATPase n=1 Tax=Rhizobium ruizarguesonis TaxID=2081791 RepID=UPI00103104F1|nr:ATP-binding protein [Rhizobium ruizarguesonis]TAU60009.1 AAA family ATPase [Rhizobium ruizarguesonis]TAV02008.1 AAA family ATPase [Rhizobium ruizarguesonis]TAV19649.1 AAA family ATPase [Rhizobium ruizarguesonis]TAY26658.1 AAA family ATPase [Rhizobium ruizarguesonis]TAY41054.1 AAA family ATPase [Rhizobium ruizarguesonis]
MTTAKADLDSDIINLARLALAGRAQDIQLLLQRIARKTRVEKPELSSSLTALLREAPTKETPLRRMAEVAMPVDNDSRLQLLKIEDNIEFDHAPVLADDVASMLHQLIAERGQLAALDAAGLDPTKTALFVGPPGVGKTLAARWLAKQLNKPLMILDLAAVMSSYLGRTGANLRQVLDYAKQADCVLLLDELDAIAKRRDDRDEVGELKRLVTVLLQQIDDWPARGLLLAATNHPDLLDPAVWRRFEMKVEFPMPDRDAIEDLVGRLLRPYHENAGHWAKVLAIALQGKSFSDIQQSIERTRRAAAISGDALESYLQGLIQLDGLSKADRISLATMLVGSGLSQRNVQKLTGIARDTVRSHTQSEAVPRRRKGG